MSHDLAKKIFETIREEPYFLSTEKGEEASNCYFKGIKLIQELAQLGYPARGRVGEMDWAETPVPDDILALMPADMPAYHFYPEFMIDREWRTLDPSIDTRTAKLGFRITEFKGDPRSCFDLLRVLSQEQQIENFQMIEAQGFLQDYFKESQSFLMAVNSWLKQVRRD